MLHVFWKEMYEVGVENTGQTGVTNVAIQWLGNCRD